MIELKEYVSLLLKTELTQEEFLFLYFIYIRNNVDSDILKLMSKYANIRGKLENGKMKFLTKEEKESLQERGFIKVKGDFDSLSNYELQSKFTNYFIDIYDMGNEFIDTFPSFLNINGKPVNAKNWNLEEFRLVYAKRIKFLKKEHDLVILDVKYGVLHNLINQGLRKFVESEQWLALRELRIAKKVTNDIRDF